MRILKHKLYSPELAALICLFIIIAFATIFISIQFNELLWILFGSIILFLLLLIILFSFQNKFVYIIIIINIILISFFKVIWYAPPIDTGLDILAFQIENVSIHWTDIYIFIIALMTFFTLIFSNKREKKHSTLWKNSIFRLLSLYSLYIIFIAAPMAYFKGIPVDSIARRLIPHLSLLLYFIFFYVMLEKEYFNLLRWEKLLRKLSIALLLISIWNLLIGNVFTTSSGTIRTLWGVSCIIFGMNFISGYARKRPKIIDMLIGIVGIMMVNHRSAFVSLAIVAFLSTFWSESAQLKTKTATVARNVAVISIIILIFLILSPSIIVKQFSTRLSDTFNLKDSNTLARLQMWKLAFNTFLHNPILGIGLQSDIYQGEIEELISPHNFVIRILAQEGLVGITFFIIFFSIISIHIAKFYSFDRRTFWIISMSILFYVSYCLFNTYFFKVQSQLYLMLMIAMAEHYSEKYSEIKHRTTKHFYGNVH